MSGNGIGLNPNADMANVVEVKVLSATTARQRRALDGHVNEYLEDLASRELHPARVDTLQSSDREFHCVTFVIFAEPRGVRRS